MNKVFVLLTILGIANINILLAQRNCASSNIYQNQLIRDSSFRYNRQVIENLNQRFFSNPSNKRLFSVTTVIPVVVHVLFNDEAQKITTQQVASQIKSLNEDFSATNHDLGLVPTPFKSLIAGDLGIRFELAKIDPVGRQTNGILFVKTNVKEFLADESMKFSALGGSDAWSRDEYLNIWVCNLGAELLGYAQFPGGPASTDGVVILNKAFGSMGTATYPFNKGRTLTHEVGHWLDLYHIWGDDHGLCTGSDNISDTPNQADANQKDPTFPKISCDNGPHGDLFVNYMDYVNDKSMVMFTKEQGLRMRSTLYNSRSTLYLSSGLSENVSPLQRKNSLQFLKYE